MFINLACRAMYYTRLLFLLIIGMAACRSGRTALRRGDFDQAVTLSAHRLARKSNHADAPAVLQQAFARAYEQHQTAIRQITKSVEPFRWERIYAEYEQLQTLTDQARTAGGDWLNQYPADYADRRREARELAATDRYEAAEQAFAYHRTDRLAAKEAYQQYRKAGDWVLNFRDAQAKADAAFPYAVLRVVIEPLTPSFALTQSDYRALQAEIGRAMERRGQPSPFVLFIPGGPVPGDSLPVHQVVQMTVVDYDAGVVSNASSSRTVESTQAFKVGEKKINDSTKVAIMEKAKGTLTTYTRQIKSGMLLKIRALDNQNGRVLWEDAISESRTFADEWFSFTGDTRALNGQSLKTSPVTPPSAWDWLRSMSEELASDIAGKLQNKYDDE